MILGSHNSWSFNKPKKWWMKLLRFAAQCQDLNIQEQYERGVRCFDLRIRFDYKGIPIFAHGPIVFDISLSDIFEDLKWLNSKGDCYLRVIHEIRNKRQFKNSNIEMFKGFCEEYEKYFTNIKFYHGRNLYNWKEDYKFKTTLREKEYYSSVCPPVIDDWNPRIYAKLFNHKVPSWLRVLDRKPDVVLIDFVNYGNVKVDNI